MSSSSNANNFQAECPEKEKCLAVQSASQRKEAIKADCSASKASSLTADYNFVITTSHNNYKFIISSDSNNISRLISSVVCRLDLHNIATLQHC